MAPLTRADLSRHSPLAWVAMLALLAMAAWFWSLGKGSATYGTLLAGLGCLGLILPPRERMAVLPQRVRRLPRLYDVAPVLGTVLTSPGYGLGWFYGANPFDEFVHLANGALAGAVFAGLVLADGAPRSRARMTMLCCVFGFALGVAWEVFEWLVDIIGDWTDTWTDVVLTAGGAALAGALHRRKP
ncbi:hypothetical protein [Sabulicella glaciei]|uniref:VanZ family protein n=1 Tax=Sabulicella glaciei TaxID=2984948 RepID=A0ABT3NU93_9PROT|nr:hypothetical protein [Roseococcus sp. MDT2-1-1]MCW8085119.1 hypothetical protein [Roseococcus sp. MDT2-1-1]